MNSKQTDNTPLTPPTPINDRHCIQAHFIPVTDVDNNKQTNRQTTDKIYNERAMRVGAGKQRPRRPMPPLVHWQQPQHRGMAATLTPLGVRGLRTARHRGALCCHGHGKTRGYRQPPAARGNVSLKANHQREKREAMAQ